VSYCPKPQQWCIAQYELFERAGLIIDGQQKCLRTADGFYKKYETLEKRSDIFFTTTDTMMISKADVILKPHQKRIVDIPREITLWLLKTSSKVGSDREI
jgi:hypothetical protein